MHLAVNGVHPPALGLVNPAAGPSGPATDAHSSGGQSGGILGGHSMNPQVHKWQSEAEESAGWAQVGIGGGKRQRDRERDFHLQTLLRVPSGSAAAGPHPAPSASQAPDLNAGAVIGVGGVGGQHGSQAGGKAGQAGLKLQGFALNSGSGSGSGVAHQPGASSLGNHNISCLNSNMKPANAFKGSHLRQASRRRRRLLLLPPSYACLAAPFVWLAPLLTWAIYII